MLRLRKAKKIIVVYENLEEAIEDTGVRFGEQAKTFVIKNMFGLAIKGSRIGFGNGFILENKE